MFKVMVVAAVLMLTACDGISPDIQNNSLMQPTYEYELDTWMENSEIYEFKPKSSENISCVVFILDNLNSVSMECFPVK